MCGILAIFGSTESEETLRQMAVENAKQIRHRGPDWSGVAMVDGCNVICHERLSIMDPQSGVQPLVSDDGAITLAVNGEIYNYKQIIETLEEPYSFKTASDCECIIPLYQQKGQALCHDLRGMYSFVLYDSSKKSYIAVRDHMGITPLYMGRTSDGATVFASELKALKDLCTDYKIFPPGHIYSSETGLLKKWFQPDWMEPGHMANTPLDLAALRIEFETAVKQRMMTDVPWGVLLSGGLDSSLVASIAVREFKTWQAKAQEQMPKLYADSQKPNVHSFTIGLEGSPDLAAAKSVADFLGTEHHEFVFTVREGLDAVRDVIYHLETYDVTTIRASTPMYLMSRKIKSMGIKMVLSGEGADEALGGYLYFHKAPDAKAFHKETVDKLKGLHQFDCLRANKATSAWGLEARVPFLDKDFLQHVMNLDAREKMCRASDSDRDGESGTTTRAEGNVEKWVLRKAFDDEKDPYLPKDVLWRQKEQFSDGVGYSWIDGLKDHASGQVTDAMLKNAKFVFPENTPTTKEALFYRMIFTKHFPDASATKTVPGGKSIACSTAAAIAWDKSFSAMADPSGRAVSAVHDDAYAQGSLGADVATTAKAAVDTGSAIATKPPSLISPASTSSMVEVLA
jgi:asparagine synthase (glutamine-hydrolysing)